MFLHGNFALVTPAGLLQMLCQEQRSVTLRAWRGTDYVEIIIFEGLIVGARCDGLAGPEAVYQLAAWDSGQFLVELIDAIPTSATMAASWEELLLEAARRRDESALALRPLPPAPAREQLDQLMEECPALGGAALVGYDGRLLATVGLDGALEAQAAAVAGALFNAGRRWGSAAGSGIMLFVSGGRKLILAELDAATLLLGVPAPGANVAEAGSQVAAHCAGTAVS